MEFDWKSRQNADGGWGYGSSPGTAPGTSWTEPTALILLAQQATSKDEAGFAAGIRFLRSMARPDGGFQPQPGVAESTWVASLVALLPEQAIGREALHGAITWLKGQTGQESSLRFRLQQRLAGNKNS